MKKRILIFAAALAAAVVLFGAGAAYGAGSAEPGTQGDPLVTLSYLEKRLSETGNFTDARTQTASEGFSRVELAKGQSLILSDGAEFVVYSGNGTVLGTTGLISLTGGEKFNTGTSTVLYTLYLGIGGTSGVKASGSMVLYVTGGYRIE